MVMPKHSPVQKILFGPPGSGKSFRAREIGVELNVETDCTIEATFHPAYDYGDFVVKLLPMTVRRIRQFNGMGALEKQQITPEAESAIEYRTHVGHLIRAVAKALEVGPKKNVLLIIDEINRGDCARIFGDIFQLLDRSLSGWSQYGVNLSDLAFSGLMKGLGWISMHQGTEIKWKKDDQILAEGEIPEDIWTDTLDKPQELKSLFSKIPVLHLPPNLSIIGTMNTSDESVYYMDTAFKRRWSFEFIRWNYGPEDQPAIKTQRKIRIEGTDHTWEDFLKKLNNFIANSSSQRRIDDKQVGLWFLRPNLSSLYLAFQKAAEKPSPTVNDWNLLGLVDAPGDAKQKIRGWNNGLKEYISNILERDNLNNVYQQLLAINEGDKEKYPSPRLAAIRLMRIGEANWGCYISAADIRCKLMHFLWDNVFSRDKEVLENLIFKKNKGKLRTFDDFSMQYKNFVNKVMEDELTPIDNSGQLPPDDNA